MKQAILFMVLLASLCSTTVLAEPAIVINKDAGICGMPGADADGNIIFGGIGSVTIILENDNRVMLKCHAEGITNLSDKGQSFSGFNCGINSPESEPVITSDTHATVSASGQASMTCSYKK